jgi:DNA-binding NarL/FixJ family response regulator
MISIMMCDDNTMFRKGLKQIIEKITGYCISAEAENGSDCLSIIKNGFIPDLLILEISLPNGVVGYEIVRYLQLHFARIKLLVLSAITDEAAVKAMIRFGVNGYIFKTADPHELENAIKKVMAGENYYPESFVFSQIEIELIKTTPIPWAENITEREMTAVKLLAQDLAQKQVADEMGISISVVRKKLDHLFKKTKCQTCLGAINFLRKVGILK